MLPLAKLWTWIGSFFIPIAIGWSIFVRNGLANEPPAMGVLISRAYWGVLITLLAGCAMIWAIALYVRAAKARRASILVPPNTMFEEKDERNPFISWSTVAVYFLAIVSALIIFGVRYSDSLVYRWDNREPLANGFWTSRVLAHQSGCDDAPCFAVGQRIDAAKGPIFGVNEYVLYLTDGVLLTSALVLAAGVISLISAAWDRKSRAAPFPTD